MPKDRGFVSAVDILRGRRPVPAQPADPRAKPTANQQLALFQNFLCNNDEEREKLSNAIDLWDSVPRYSVSRETQEKARAADGRLEKHTAMFRYHRSTWTCTITPARVTDLDGVERDYFPSLTEEIVEDALRKLAIDQQAGFFDKPSYRSGVRFSLYALRQEMARQGHTRSYQEIELSLNILSGSIIDLKGDDAERGEALARSAYLSSLIAVSQNRLKNDPEAKWAVQFHPLVTCSIDQVTYRQFNYALMMKHKSQLTRWLHKQFVLKFTGADLLKPLEVRYSTVKRDSGMLDQYARERDGIKAMVEAIEDLKKCDILYKIERQDIKGPRNKTLDVIFNIWPSLDFVKEVKAANKRQADDRKLTGR